MRKRWPRRELAVKAECIRNPGMRPMGGWKSVGEARSQSPSTSTGSITGATTARSGSSHPPRLRPTTGHSAGQRLARAVRSDTRPDRGWFQMIELPRNPGRFTGGTGIALGVRSASSEVPGTFTRRLLGLPASRRPCVEHGPSLVSTPATPTRAGSLHVQARQCHVYWDRERAAAGRPRVGCSVNEDSWLMRGPGCAAAAK